MGLLSKPFQMKTIIPLLASGAAVLAGASSILPHDKLYGVSLGSWLVLEAWMLPQEWEDMGGEVCDDCSTCISSEFAFAQAYPDTVDSEFEKHWSTWFTQDDVNKLVEYGINTVRIPLGYWLVEPLVDRATEYYPRGGIKQLKRGLAQLKAAGISAILDHHALPGVQTASQQFTGNCTTNVQFYTDYNYERALIWTAVMTAVAHLDSDFESVFAIEAVNEPLTDASQTPGYGDFQKNFVQTIRAVEAVLGIASNDLNIDASTTASSLSNLLQETGNLTEALVKAGTTTNGTVIEALVAAAPMLVEVAEQLDMSLTGLDMPKRSPLTTMFMDVSWQYAGNASNPADAADGPQAYDNHLYYAYGGVADNNTEAYLTSICNLTRVENDAKVGDSPLIMGEWSLATQFASNDTWLAVWADAQKLAYSKAAGWIYWNFKTEESTLAANMSHSWSYFRGVENGMLTIDPSQYNDPDVCVPYLNQTTSSSSSSSASSATSASSSSALSSAEATATSSTAISSTTTSSKAGSVRTTGKALIGHSSSSRPSATPYERAHTSTPMHKRVGYNPRHGGLQF